jgi:hypothetical protein
VGAHPVLARARGLDVLGGRHDELRALGLVVAPVKMGYGYTLAMALAFAVLIWALR